MRNDLLRNRLIAAFDEVGTGDSPGLADLAMTVVDDYLNEDPGNAITDSVFLVLVDWLRKRAPLVEVTYGVDAARAFLDTAAEILAAVTPTAATSHG